MLRYYLKDGYFEKNIITSYFDKNFLLKTIILTPTSMRNLDTENR